MNANELALAKLLTDSGYEVVRGGWPDFLVIPPDGSAGIAVELKTNMDPVTPVQQRMHDALETAGIKIMVVKKGQGVKYRISGTAVQSGGFEVITDDTAPQE